MKRLRTENKNTPRFAEELFENRWKKQLHYIDWLRFKLLTKYFEGGRYLDIGCFNSPIPAEIKFRMPNAEVWAMDYAEKVIWHLKKVIPEVNYVVGNATDLPFKDNYFDYAVMGELIEHLEEPQKAVREAIRAIKRGGYLALSVPNDEAHKGAVSDEHLWSFTEQDIVELLSPYGEVETATYEDTSKHIIAFCKKK